MKDLYIVLCYVPFKINYLLSVLNFYSIAAVMSFVMAVTGMSLIFQVNK